MTVIDYNGTPRRVPVTGLIAAGRIAEFIQHH
jgi:hypothetical protein